MSQSKRLLAVLLLNISMITGLIIVGLSSHSLGVLAAGGDYVADSAAILLGLLAIYLRDKKNGHPLATTIVAGINASLLLIVTILVITESIHRLNTHTPHIQGLPAMIISIVATIAMVIGALILAGDKNDKDLHIRSVMLDTMADGVSSAAVAVTGGIIFFTKRYFWLDSAAALIIGIVIGVTAIKLMRDVVKTMLRKNNSA